MTGTESELATAASVFRRVYYDLYNSINGTRYGKKPCPRYDGGVDSYGRNHKAVWPKVAKVLLDNEIDIPTYLHDVLHGGDITNPQDAVKKWRIDKFLESRDSPEVLDRWNREEKILIQNCQINESSGFNPQVAISMAISTVDVSPLTKYMFGIRNNSDVSRYLSAAYDQYKSQKKSYDKWCDNRIPAEWK